MNNNKKMSSLKKDLLVLKYVFKFCPHFIYHSILYVVSSVIKSLSKLFLITSAIDFVMNSNNSNIMDLVLNILLYVILIVVCSIITVWYDNYTKPKYELIYRKNIQHFLYEKVKNIDMESFDDPVFFDRFSRASRDSSFRGFSVFNSIMNFIVNIANVLALGTFIIISDPLLIVIIIACIIVDLITLNLMNKNWFKIYKDNEGSFRYKRYVSRTFYRQENAAELKTTSIDDLLKEKYDEHCDNIEKRFTKGYKKIFGYNTINTFFNDIIRQGGTYILLTYRLFKGIIDVSKFTATINATFQFSSNIMEAVNIVTVLKEHALYIDDFIWVINYKPVVEKEKAQKDIEFKELKLENVSFSYPKTDNEQIKNLSLDIKKGEKIAIVGDNGGGKTTLMKLLLAFYYPTKGNILVNDINYEDFSTKDIRNIYSIVFQDFKIYACTIAENVLMRRCVTKEDRDIVINALRSVGILDKVLKLEKGIDTLVTREFDRNGITFSGGERQRLAIARVFASNKDIYILDEPTSSLDPISEARINKLIIDEGKDKTILIIAHRLSTVVDCDKIYLIRDGEIIESGTHNDLMKLNKHYAKMFNTQKSLYEKVNE